MSNDKLFFFHLDYKKTKAAVKAKIDQYNGDLRSWFENDPDDFRKKKHLQPNQTYRACTVKSCEETTLFALLEIYGGWLANNSWIKILPEAFRANNMAVATQKNNHISTRTAKRHIAALKEAGIISEKIFRGTKASFELKFNPDLIHFKPNSDYNFYLASLYKAMLGEVEVKPQVFREIYSFSGTLANFPLGYARTSCPLNSTSIILLVHKINIECGILSPDFCLRTPSTKNPAENNFLFDKNGNKESQKVCQSMNAPPIAPPPPRGSDGKPTLAAEFTEDYVKNDQLTVIVDKAQTAKLSIGNNEEDKLWKEVFSFYCYAVSVLWPDRIITTYQRNKICSEIYKHYKNAIGDKPVHPTVYSFRGAFMYRILLTRKFLKKNTFWTLESPESYFDFESKKGFNGTINWYHASKKMEEQNKLYLDHYKKFIQCWKDYTKVPGVTSYNLAVQQLGKLKQDCWKNYFNAAVSNLSQLSNTGIQEIWKTHYKV